jgi:hypothetical protein
VEAAVEDPDRLQRHAGPDLAGRGGRGRRFLGPKKVWEAAQHGW